MSECASFVHGTVSGYRKHRCRCEPCRSASREKNREYRARNRELVALASTRRDLKRLYGLSIEQRYAMVVQQGWRCPVCERSLELSGKKFHVDHDHATGTVRGILCASCNSGIGKLGDTVEGLQRALRYLENKNPRKEDPSEGVTDLFDFTASDDPC